MKDLEANVEIGDFRIVRRLGAGGMGVVYLARQVSLDRLVALKVLGAALTHPSDIIRFRREATAAARLHHPNIATIHFVGQDEHGCYMAMEYIDGVSLRDLVTRMGMSHDPHLSIATILHRESGRQSQPPRIRFDEEATELATLPLEPVAERDGRRVPALDAITPEAQLACASGEYLKHVCEIMRDAARALDHAHRQHVVHRDIKPQNIMLDQNGVVKIIDFGVARFFDDATITQQGQLVGTPMYMSPEQVAGHSVDGRSDIYSLGLVAYELLTLRRPLMAPTREAILRGVVTKAMVPVSWKNSGVPRSVESVVHKALLKDPDDRYQSAAEFADDLQRSIDKQPVVARPYRYKFDMREIVAERPWSVTAAAFWFYFVAIFYSIVVPPYEIGMAIANPAGSRSVPTTRSEFAVLAAGYLLLAVAACWTAIRILSGRKLARWMAIPVAVISIGLSLAQPYHIIHGAWLHQNGRYLALMSFWLLNRFAVVLGGCGAILVLLIERPAKQWFLFSRQVRSEHDEMLNSIHT